MITPTITCQPDHYNCVCQSQCATVQCCTVCVQRFVSYHALPTISRQNGFRKWSRVDTVSPSTTLWLPAFLVEYTMLNTGMFLSTLCSIIVREMRNVTNSCICTASLMYCQIATQIFMRSPACVHAFCCRKYLFDNTGKNCDYLCYDHHQQTRICNKSHPPSAIVVSTVPGVNTSMNKSLTDPCSPFLQHHTRPHTLPPTCPGRSVCVCARAQARALMRAR